MLCQRVIFCPNKISNKKTTGYSYMVCDIIKSVVSLGENVDVYAITSEKKIYKYANAKVLQNNFLLIVKNLKLKYITLGLKRIIDYMPGFRMALTLMYYYVACGLVESYLKEENYDVVHIHGFGYAGRAYVDCCESCNQKYLLTFHALASFSERNIKSRGRVKNEEVFLETAYKQKVMLTTVSTKMKMDICARYNDGKDMDNIAVVLNGVQKNTIGQYNRSIDIRKKHGISNNKKLLLSVGNLSYRKNQEAIIRAISILSSNLKNEICVLFLGVDHTKGKLEELARKLNVSNYVRFCGNINRNSLCNYYFQSDLNLTVSISEAFGLPIIEGFFCGLPSLIFSDLEAVEDLFSEDAMIKIADRSDIGLANGIISALGKIWDRNKIMEHAKKFSIEKAATKYIEIYNKII
jgi:glycosyltransferase involved in cell wall biosynthesis